MTQLQFSDTHGASSASLGSPTGTGRTDCALGEMIVSDQIAEVYTAGIYVSFYTITNLGFPLVMDF